MQASLIVFVINIAGAAALLIWAVRLVRTGFERAFGIQLRAWLRRSTARRVQAAATGALAAILMQSSTAVAVLTAGFVANGAIGTLSGLTIMLGADLGSAIVTQILVAKLVLVVPVLLLVGVSFFLRSQSRRLRQVGRILIGLALVFLSLDLIRDASAPLVGSDGAKAAMLYLGNDLATAFVLAAGFSWLVHSSVAAVLLFVTLASEGILPGTAAFAMVLGANLGGALIAYFLTFAANTEVRRMVTANLVLRGGGAVLLVFVIARFDVPTHLLGDGAGRQALNLHLGYNLVLLLLALPFMRAISNLTARFMPARAGQAALAAASQTSLDPAALDSPRRALTCASRELVRLADLIESMLRQIIGLYDRYDEVAAATIQEEYKQCQQMLFGLKIYLAKLSGHEPEGNSAMRALDLSATAVNLDSGADAIARKMLALAHSKEMDNVTFSADGWRDLTDFHDLVLRNVQLGIAVLMTQDPASARELVEQKERVREMEQKFQNRHLARLQKGLAESIESSAVHLETLRALKLVNTSFAMIAYPILQESGDLLESRLAASSEDVVKWSE